MKTSRLSTNVCAPNANASALRSGALPTRSLVAEHLGVQRKTFRCWLDRAMPLVVLTPLLTDEKPGSKPGQRLLPQAVLDSLYQRLNTEQGFTSYLEVQGWLATEFAEEVNYKSLHGPLHYRLKTKLKVPRPRHPKK